MMFHFTFPGTRPATKEIVLYTLLSPDVTRRGSESSPLIKRRFPDPGTCMNFHIRIKYKENMRIDDDSPESDREST